MMNIKFTVFATLLVVGTATAQDDPRIEVTVAIVKELVQADATAMLLHREGQQPENVILLTARTARPKVLAGALAVLFKDIARGQKGPSEKTLKVDGLPERWSGSLQPYQDLLERVKNAPIRELSGVGSVRFADTKVYPQRPKNAFIDEGDTGNPFVPPSGSAPRIRITLVNDHHSSAAPNVERDVRSGAYVITINASKTHSKQLSQAVRKALLEQSGYPAKYADDRDYIWAEFALQKLRSGPGSPSRLELWLRPLRTIL